MNKFITLDGREIHFEEVEKGVFKEVEKQELIGGVFEEGEIGFRIYDTGAVNAIGIQKDHLYAVQQGRVWKTREEAERKVEIDNLIAKHRITDREVLEDTEEKKYCIEVDGYKYKLDYAFSYGYTRGMSLTEEGVIEITKKVSKAEWRRFVELAR